MGLVNKARSDGILSDDMADEIKTGVMLRNLFSHPTTGMEGSCQVTNIFLLLENKANCNSGIRGLFTTL